VSPGSHSPAVSLNFRLTACRYVLADGCVMRIGGIGIKRLKLMQPVASLKRAEAWRKKHRAMRERFESINAAMTNAIIGAQADLASAQAQLAVRASIKRVQEAAGKRLEKAAAETAARLDAVAAKIDKTA
jgi:hypothetical protein